MTEARGTAASPSAVERPRSETGNQSATTLVIAGKCGPSAIPRSVLSRNNIQKPLARPIMAVHADQRKAAAAQIRCEPHLSTMMPPAAVMIM